MQRGWSIEISHTMQGEITPPRRRSRVGLLTIAPLHMAYLARTARPL